MFVLDDGDHGDRGDGDSDDYEDDEPARIHTRAETDERWRDEARGGRKPGGTGDRGASSHDPRAPTKAKPKTKTKTKTRAEAKGEGEAGAKSGPVKPDAPTPPLPRSVTTADALEIVYGSRMGIDAVLWGPPLWDILSSLARAVDDEGCGTAAVKKRGEGDAEKSARERFCQLAYSLRYVLPCAYCRESYRGFIARLPPEPFLDGCGTSARVDDGVDHGEEDETAEEAAAVAAAEEDDGEGKGGRGNRAMLWVWRLHNLVNAKLGRTQHLPFRKFVRRSRVWSSCVNPARVWDFLTMISLNYPNADTDERDDKRGAYLVFLISFSSLCGLDPWLSSMSAYVRPLRGPMVAGERCDGEGCSWKPGCGAWDSRRAFATWLSSRMSAWSLRHLDVRQRRAVALSRVALVRHAAAVCVEDDRKTKARETETLVTPQSVSMSSPSRSRPRAFTLSR